MLGKYGSPIQLSEEQYNGFMEEVENESTQIVRGKIEDVYFFDRGAVAIDRSRKASVKGEIPISLVAILNSGVFGKD